MMLKYRTEQFVMKIKAPVICRFDDQELNFEDGSALAEYEFEKSYGIEAISVADGAVVVELKESPVPSINSIGDELVQGSDWIEEHKKLHGKEPNLFDGD